MPGRCVRALLLVSISACALPVARPGFDSVRDLAMTRTGHRVHWYQGTPEDEQAFAAVRDLLSRPLTRDAAVQVALLNNRSLLAVYEELGVAQADLVKAGLLANPVFGVELRSRNLALNPPALVPAPPEVEASVGMDLLSILLIPLRTRLAEQQFEQARLRVGNAVIQLAAEVQTAFWEHESAVQLAQARRLFAEAADAGAELARRQREAGNIQELEQAVEESLMLEARLGLAQADAMVLEAREHLNRLMGVWGPQTAWTSQGSLPDLPHAEPAVEKLESLAVTERLDLAAERRQIELLTRALDLNRPWLLPLLDADAHAELEADGLAFGPGVDVQIPIFDFGQAERAALRAQKRAAEQRFAGLAVDIRSEVRSARNRLLTTRAMAEYYRDRLLPVRARVVEQTLLLYNRMFLGVFALLRARQDELAARQGHIETLLAYWQARVELERAVGGRLPTPTVTESSPPTSTGHTGHRP
ncbi:MAG: TolC family protein [Myxococcota bacterium]